VSDRAVFLDRDGVLNRALVRDGRPCPPREPDEFEILPGVVDACVKLQAAGFDLVVVTNQPDVARGTVAPEAVECLNRRLRQLVAVDEIVVCPHDDEDDCPCRKPRPGMLLAAAERRRLNLVNSYMVGDRWRDIEAGRRAGCRTIFIDHGYDERAPKASDAVVASLGEAVTWILEEGEKKTQ
jgi:D-glycero-D-manno-heptose 1,7-bisphosphate phosphatase